MILNSIRNLVQQSFTGIAHIKSKTHEQHAYWRIYFNFGSLIWANGGCHSHRSWRRHLTQYYSKVDLEQINIEPSDRYRCPEYNILEMLLKRNLVGLEDTTKLVINKLQEVFFDIFQRENIEPLYLEAEPVPLDILIETNSDSSLISVELETVIRSAQQQWLKWNQGGFISIIPDTAPRIKSHEQLKQEVSEVVYQNFVKLLDGRRTLRDLASGMNKDLLLLTKSLFPYIHKGLVELIKVPDLKLVNSNTKQSKSSSKSIAKKSDKPLIACIDDSPQVCMIMKEIITQAGYSFLGIQQPIQAVPSLISANPTIIFLDIGMPILNGYEVCTQIRRVSKLQDIPIVMLTGNDGVFDRVKAKVCGASDFLSKPIEADKIVQTIEKFAISTAAVSS